MKYKDLEEEQYAIKKVNNTTYDILTINEVINKSIGRINFDNKRLYYSENQKGKLIFENFGLTENGNSVDNSTFNVELINRAFKNRGYETLEMILHDTMLT